MRQGEQAHQELCVSTGGVGGWCTTVTPAGVAGMGTYVRGQSRSMASRKGESGTGVEAKMASRMARTWGCKKGETVVTSSGIAGGATGGEAIACCSGEGSSRSSQT